ELADVVHLAGELEIGGVLQRFQDRAAEIGIFLEQHGGRQIVRCGVDGVTEQQKLHHGDHHDHRKRDPVAAELDELLDHHGKATPPEAEGPLPCLFTPVVRRNRHAHWKLSFERPISSMKTSSSDGSECCQWRPCLSRQGAMADSSAALSRPETCSEVPNGATMSMPSAPVSFSDSDCRSSPVTV